MTASVENLLNPFFDAIEKNIFKINAVQKNQFIKYYGLLVEWNSKINLISRNERNIVNRHFLNSAAIASFRKFQPGEKIIDLGSGGGFPAMILKIMFPESFFLLVESIKKKSGFLDEVIARLKLSNIEAVNERAENMSQLSDYGNNFDFVTARALAPLTELLPLARLFLKPGGEMLLLKGKRFASEIHGLEKTNNGNKLPIISRSLNESGLFDEHQEGVLLIVKNKF